MKRPPAAAALLLRLLLPAALHEVIAGDLEEEWRRREAVSGRLLARLAYWRLVVRSIADCWRDRLRTPPMNPHPKPHGEPAMHALLQDVRYAARTMRKSPGFSAAAVLTLALGIGATTAIFSMVSILALKPLPYHDPSRVAFLLGTDTESGAIRFSLRVADYLDIAAQAQSFERVAAYTYLSANITGGDIPDRVQAYRVTANTFALLGVDAALGRTLTDADGGPGRPAVAVISDGLWRRRFGADPAAVGRRIAVNGVTHEIVGVMPRRFEYPVFNFKGELWVPWAIDGAAAATDRGASASATVIARIRPEVGTARASAELQAIMRRLATDHPATNATLSAKAVEMGRLDDEQAGASIYIPVVTVVIVLLLACGNVANLLLARGVSRAREISVRAAVGASRWRIARQLLVESLLLASVGAAGGVALAQIALSAVRASLPEAILTTMPNIGELGVDRLTLAFTTVVTVVTSLVFGLVPAWRASRPALVTGLREGSATGGTRSTRRLRTVLVVGEVALATLLLVCAGLLARSYAALLRVSPGFSAEGVLTLAITIPEDRYPTIERRRQFFEQVAGELGTLPGVEAAGGVNVLPFSTYERGTRFAVDGAAAPLPGREPRTSFRVVTPGYFDTLRIPVHTGRAFDRSDRDGAAPVAIVNRAFARQHLAGGDPVGRRVRLGDAAPWLTIVGVSGDVHHWQVTQAPEPELYVPLAQSGPPMMMFALRTGGATEDLIRPVRDRILAIDPLQPIYHVRPMTQMLDDAMLPRRTSAALVLVFSGIALLLAIVGVYGVVAYGVTQQMPEFGLRLALGATPAGLVRLVLTRCALMVGVGIGVGAAAALALSGVLASQLVGVGRADPLTYIVAIAGLGALGLSAGILPAWRASTAEPLSALRTQ